MKTRQRKMKKTISRVSALQAIRTTRIALIGLLLIDFVQRVYYKYPVIGLYVLIILTVLPILLKTMVKPWIKDGTEEELPLLQKKYSYTKSEFVGHLGTVWITILVLVLWAGQVDAKTIKEFTMRYSPSAFVGFYIFTIVLMYIYYKKRAISELKSNKL